VASLQDDSVGVATALSPVGAGHFKFYHTTFIFGLGLAAEKVADSIIDCYNRPPRKFEDLYKLMREEHVDPLKEFTEAYREELKVMLKRL